MVILALWGQFRWRYSLNDARWHTRAPDSRPSHALVTCGRLRRSHDRLGTRRHPRHAPASDETYQVTISGIVGATQTSYTYNVTLVNPADVGLPLNLTGSTSPIVGVPNPYTFPASAANSYTLRARLVDSAVWKEGAEPADPNLLIDGTDSSYSLITSALAQASTNSLHLAFPDFTEQSVELDRSILPGATSNLNFFYRRHFSSTTNTISAEVSTDDGASWTPSWSITGICNGSCSTADWDTTWQSVTVPLSTYADRPVRVRFIYRPIGSAFIGTTDSFGVFLDEISVSDSGTLGSEELMPVTGGSTQVDFVPAVAAAYLLDLQANLVCLHSSFGPALRVMAVPGS